MKHTRLKWLECLTLAAIAIVCILYLLLNGGCTTSLNGSCRHSYSTTYHIAKEHYPTFGIISSRPWKDRRPGQSNYHIQAVSIKGGELIYWETPYVNIFVSRRENPDWDIVKVVTDEDELRDLFDIDLFKRAKAINRVLGK